MRRVIAVILLLFLFKAAQAQQVTSRNNYTGVWNQRASWMQNWTGISNTLPLPVATIATYGYLTHGFLNTPADITLSGSASSLTVHDTLRIHGNLSNINYAALVVEAGGVLIVHGNYQQNDWSTLKVKGKMIVQGDFKMVGNTGYSEVTGRLYVGGASSAGGWNMNIKTLQELNTADPATAAFFQTNVVASHCSGNNSGRLSFSGVTARIVRWESSTDFFKTNIQVINNTSAQHTYTNLTRTTSFRVYYEKDPGVFVYSSGATVLIEPLVNAGSISGQNSFCSAQASVALALSNQIGTVLRWEWSIDNFATAPQVLTTSAETVTLTNVNATTYVRAVVQSCSQQATAAYVVTIHTPAKAGVLSGPTAVCKGTNTGVLQLLDSEGAVLRWEQSADGFVSDTRPIANTTTSYTFTNLTTPTWYRTVVQKASCSPVYSPAFKVQVTELAGGVLSGPTQLCRGTGGTLQLQNYKGTVVRWEWSSDGFATHSATISTTQASYSFSGLEADTWFKVVVSDPNCGTTSSALHFVKVDQLSLSGTISGTGSVCTGTNSGTLMLEGYQGQILGWEYSTDGFVAHAQAIANTAATYTFSNLGSSRWYRAEVKNGSCAAVKTQPFKVSVYAVVAGTVSGPELVCKDINSGTLQLQGHAGTIQRWERSSDNFVNDVQPIAQTTTSLTFTNISADTWYRAVIGNTSCADVYTTAWRVQVSPPSMGGELSGATALCADSNTGTLQLQGQQGAILRWEFSRNDFASEVVAINATASEYTFTNLTATTSYRVVVQNGSCGVAYSTVARVVIDAPAQAGSLTGSTTVCWGENSGNIQLQNRQGNVTRWESSTDGFVTSMPLAITADLLSYQNLTETTSYRAVVQNGAACGEAYSPVATISVMPALQTGRIEGPQVVAEGINSGQLRLAGHTGQIIRWEVSTDNFLADVQPIASTTDTHLFENLTVASWYRVVLQSAECPAVYGEAIKVDVNHRPLALSDTLQVHEEAFVATQSVLQNDSDPDGNALQVVAAQFTTAAGGTAEIDNAGLLRYFPPANYLGIDSLQYSVCDNVAGAPLCADATIVLDVRLPDPALVVYQGVSPNDDLNNEHWQIDFIDRYPNNLVQLYDRYGSLVYEQAGYNNRDKVFVGIANKGVRVGSSQLPEGTYYYKIITAPNAPLLKGFLVLKK